MSTEYKLTRQVVVFAGDPQLVGQMLQNLYLLNPDLKVEHIVTGQYATEAPQQQLITPVLRAPQATFEPIIVMFVVCKTDRPLNGVILAPEPDKPIKATLKN